MAHAGRPVGMITAAAGRARGGPAAAVARLRALIAGLTPWRLALMLGLLGVLPLTLLTPPLQVPDEMEHFYRSYQISLFAVAGLVEDGAAGAVLPASLSEMTAHFLGTKDIHAPDRPVLHYPIAATLGYLSVPLDPERQEFTDFSSTVIFSPLAYLPQAAAILAGRLFHLGPLGLLYAARIATALVSVAIAALAIRILPFARPAMLASLALPMTLYEFASVSADALIISTAFLYTATALAGLDRGKWHRHEILLAGLAGLVFCSTKITYFPLLFLGAPALLRMPRDRSVLWFTLAVPALVLSASILWVAYASPFFVIARHGGDMADVHRQMLSLLDHPSIVFAIAVNSFLAYGQGSLDSMIGMFGWATLRMPQPIYALAIFGLILAVLAQPPGRPKFPPFSTAWNFALMIATVASIGGALYLTWTSVGSTGIECIQGRYFTPMLPLLLASLTVFNRLSVPEEVVRLTGHAAVAIAVATILAMYATLAIGFGIL